MTNGSSIEAISMWYCLWKTGHKKTIRTGSFLCSQQTLLARTCKTHCAAEITWNPTEKDDSCCSYSSMPWSKASPVKSTWLVNLHDKIKRRSYFNLYCFGRQIQMEKYHIPWLDAMSSLWTNKTGYICSHCFELMLLFWLCVFLFLFFFYFSSCALKPAHQNLNIMTRNEQEQDLVTFYYTVFCSCYCLEMWL